MTILCMKELGFYHYVDMSMIDLIDYIGQEKDFIEVVEDEDDEDD